MYKQIKRGDIVRVNFNNCQFTLCQKARVENVPHATGESWMFYDLETKKTHYVTEGCTITLLESK